MGQRPSSQRRQQMILFLTQHCSELQHSFPHNAREQVVNSRDTELSTIWYAILGMVQMNLTVPNRLNNAKWLAEAMQI